MTTPNGDLVRLSEAAILLALTSGDSETILKWLGVGPGGSPHSGRAHPEADLRDDVARYLDQWGLEPRTEVRVVGGRVDLVVGHAPCLVEFKIGSGVASAISQLRRYAESWGQPRLIVALPGMSVRLQADCFRAGITPFAGDALAIAGGIAISEGSLL